MNLNSSGSIGGLGTFTYTISAIGTYFLECRSTFIAPSGTSLTIAQSGSASNSYSSITLPANATHVEIANSFRCAIGDVLTLTISSSNVSDANGMNRLESVFRLSQTL